jgi:hypothetical protein
MHRYDGTCTTREGRPIVGVSCDRDRQYRFADFVAQVVLFSFPYKEAHLARWAVDCLVASMVVHAILSFGKEGAVDAHGEDNSDFCDVWGYWGRVAGVHLAFSTEIHRHVALRGPSGRGGQVGRPLP